MAAASPSDVSIVDSTAAAAIWFVSRVAPTSSVAFELAAAARAEFGPALLAAFQRQRLCPCARAKEL